MKIVVNGVEYDSIEQMPPAVRRQYLEAVGALCDEDGDGVPDSMQKPGSSNVVTHESIIYNGREYKSRDELPSEVRELLEHMPEPKPGETETCLEVKTTRVFPPQVNLSARWPEAQERQSEGITLRLSWFLVLVLATAVLALLFLWLSGIKPGDLWGR